MKVRFEQDYALSSYDASALTASMAMADYFSNLVTELLKSGIGTLKSSEYPTAEAYAGKLAANWLMGSISAKLNEENKDISACPVSAMTLAGLLKRIADNTISSKIAKEVFDAMWAGEGEADSIIDKKGLKQVTDNGAIEAIVDEVLATNAAMVAEVKAGKEKAFNGLVGQVMKASKGKANPAQVNEILKKKLS
jgi:aspartyl-tRNA(Asn)/glutamyl-tRNA(Gln) amidotransferase subunit B